MKNIHVLAILVFANVVALVLIAANPPRDKFDKISMREFELVDQNGKQRALIKVEEDGEVVFRLKDAAGSIRVKLGAGSNGSGMVLLDENTNPGVHMLAKKSGSTITVLSKDGKKEF